MFTHPIIFLKNRMLKICPFFSSLESWWVCKCCKGGGAWFSNKYKYSQFSGKEHKHLRKTQPEQQKSSRYCWSLFHVWLLYNFLYFFSSLIRLSVCLFFVFFIIIIIFIFAACTKTQQKETNSFQTQVRVSCCCQTQWTLALKMSALDRWRNRWQHLTANCDSPPPLYA